MTQDHSSKLSFSIEESVWLNKGQEVDEIVSLALDPEITVQENGEYVLIRGGLKLTGEYRSNGDLALNEVESDSLIDQVSYRSIEEVTLNADGTGEIKHYFPIDVTIPLERIRSLDEIYVIVESFDYDLPERGCIQLTADVAITGMTAGNVKEKRVEEEITAIASVEEVDPNVDQEEMVINSEDRSFYFEAFSQGTEQEQEQEPVEEIIVPFPKQEARYEEETETPFTADEAKRQEDRVEVEEEMEAIVETEVEVDEAEVKSPSVSFGVVKERPRQEEVIEAEPIQHKEPSFSMLKGLAQETKKQVAENSVEDRHEEKAEVEVKEVEIPLANEAEAKELVEQTPPREENALYLTKMLTKGEEAEFKKIKIAIIRQNETLDVIAERYEVTQSTLIKVNRLNDAEVEEGQILYIPVKQ